MDFGKKLKNLRVDKGLSQEQLAQKLNISRQAVSKWESNNSYPDLDNLIQLREIFNISLDDLIINDEKLQGNIELNYNNNEELISNKKGKNPALEDKNTEENNEDEDEEMSVSLIIGGFIIGTALGLITGNFNWSTAGAFLGMGLGYILEYFLHKKRGIIHEE